MGAGERRAAQRGDWGNHGEAACRRPPARAPGSSACTAMILSSCSPWSTICVMGGADERWWVRRGQAQSDEQRGANARQPIARPGQVRGLPVRLARPTPRALRSGRPRHVRPLKPRAARLHDADGLAAQEGERRHRLLHQHEHVQRVVVRAVGARDEACMLGDGRRRPGRSWRGQGKRPRAACCGSRRMAAAVGPHHSCAGTPPRSRARGPRTAGLRSRVGGEATLSRGVKDGTAAPATESCIQHAMQLTRLLVQLVLDL